MEDRYAFLAEWFDPTAALMRRYQLFFYPKDGSMEMFDVKNQRVFLKRIKYDDIHPQDLFVGNRVNVFSRQLNLIDYGDQYTRNKLGSKKERTLALIKPDVVTKIGDVIESIYSSNLTVTKAKMTRLSWSQAADFYMEHQSKPFFNNLVQFMSSGSVVAMEIMGDEATSVWRKLLGPTDSAAARKEAPQSIRAHFGTDGLKNVGHGSDSLDAAARELEFFFPSTIGHGPSNTATFTDCTCCIIKPHAVLEANRWRNKGIPNPIQFTQLNSDGRVRFSGAEYGMDHRILSCMCVFVFKNQDRRERAGQWPYSFGIWPWVFPNPCLDPGSWSMPAEL